MFKRLVTTLYKNPFAPSRNFVHFPRKLTTEFEHGYEPTLDILSKRLRKIILDRSILQKNKLIVPVTRIRQEEDTLEKLRNSRLCAGVINARDEFEDLDIVLQNRQANLLDKRVDANTNSYYLKVGDELIRCTLESVTRHHIHQWVVQAKFNRYIVGRPNLVYLPLKMVSNYKNVFINKGADIAQKIEGLWFYSYNDEYPAALEFDPKNASPAYGYRVGELVNSLPDGLELHPRHKGQLLSYIVEILKTKDVLLEKEQMRQEIKKKLKMEETQPEDEEAVIDDWTDDEHELDILEKQKKAERKARALQKQKEHAKKMPSSLKKQMAMTTFKIRDDVNLHVAHETAKPKKGQKSGGDE